MKLLYLAGTAHCGSTMLSFLLNTHPEIVSIGESAQSTKRDHDRHLHPCSCGKKIGECAFWSSVFESVTAQGHEFTPLNWAMSHGNSALEKKYLYMNRHNRIVDGIRKLLLTFRSSDVREKNDLNVLTMKSILEVSGKSIYADTSKSPNRVEMLMRHPELDISLLWLVRDVRGFVTSMKNRTNRVQPLEEAAERWRKEQIIIRRLYDKFPEEKRLLLRYEDLCQHPQASMDKIFRICGASGFRLPEDFRSTEHHIIGHKMRLSGASSVQFKEKWRASLSPDEQRKALEIAGEPALSFGYVDE